jgi:hypothetical protein
MPELCGRQVDRSKYRHNRRPPHFHLLACRANDPIADRLDNPVCSATMINALGKKQATLRMLPPEKRLHADHLARLQLNLRLIVKDKFASLDRTTQLALQAQMLLRLLVHIARIKAIVVLSRVCLAARIAAVALRTKISGSSPSSGKTLTPMLVDMYISLPSSDRLVEGTEDAFYHPGDGFDML